MVIAIIPFLIMVIGLLMYALAANPKVSEIGRIMFFCGMLVVTMIFAKQTIGVG